MLIKDPLWHQDIQVKKQLFTDHHTHRYHEILQTFTSISLAQSHAVGLLNRVDTKFIFPESSLPVLLLNLREDYDVLEVSGLYLQHYRTCYYDTPGFRLYYQHHNDIRDRYKLRVRSYLDSGLNFLEIKHKNNRNHTRKSRIATQDAPIQESPEAQAFLDERFPYPQECYVHKISNSFYRIALVSKYTKERVSLDLGIRFISPSIQFSLPGIVVAEVKQPQVSLQSVFMQEMRRNGWRSTRFSKYCVGVSVAYPQLKHNAFKPLLLDIQKIVLGGCHS